MKNNKMLLIVGGVVLLVLVAGFLLMRGGSTNLPGISSSPEDLVASALSGSGSVKCEYTGEDGSVVTAYVKNGQIRTDVTGGADGGGSFLMRDNTTWTWSDTTKEGVMYVMPEVTPVEGEALEGEVETSDEVAADLQQYKDSCKSENVPDNLFEVPSDVNFQDFSQVMNDQMQTQMDQVPAEYQQYLNQ